MKNTKAKELQETKKEVISLLNSIWNRGFAAGSGEDESFDVNVEYEKILNAVAK